TPTPSMNAHSRGARTSAHTNEMTPWSMLGGLRCTADDPNGTKSSPSRLRFCPSSRPTFRFRVPPPDSNSTYSRSVLGASGNLKERALRFKRGGTEIPCTLRTHAAAFVSLTEHSLSCIEDQDESLACPDPGG